MIGSIRMLVEYQFLRIRATMASKAVTTTMAGKPTNNHFYRRPLPKICIDFVSGEGRQIFKEALNAGYMTCFFKLSAQFRTQDEPAYCGLTSLVMALNVLEIDPGRVWKGPWRWYHEDMLDCCISLDSVKKKGINMEQFVCLSKCNNLDAAQTCALDFKSIEDFRTLIKQKTQVDDQVVIISYSRAVLNQTGSGHFSPIAGYHEGKDLVLILDTARFKYPPHWVPLTTLMEAMKTTDSDTGLPRGVVVLSRSDTYIGTLLYRPSCSFVISSEKGILSPQIWNFCDIWNLWLDEEEGMDTIELDPLLPIRQFVQTVVNCLQETTLLCLVMQCDTSNQCDSLCCTLDAQCISADEEREIRCMYTSLFKEVQTLKTYEMFKEALSLFPKKDLALILKLVECSELSNCSQKGMQSKETCVYKSCQQKDCMSKSKKLKRDVQERDSSVSLRISPENILAVLFLSWPISKTNSLGGSKKREWIYALMKEDLLDSSRKLVRLEVRSLHIKFLEVLNYHLNDASKSFDNHQVL